MNDYYAQLSVTAVKDMPDGHRLGVYTGLVWDKGKWFRNDEIDGGEWVEIPPPPPEIETYLKSLLENK